MKGSKGLRRPRDRGRTQWPALFRRERMAIVGKESCGVFMVSGLLHAPQGGRRGLSSGFECFLKDEIGIRREAISGPPHRYGRGFASGQRFDPRILAQGGENSRNRIKAFKFHNPSLIQI